jgi:hypothetical protein
LSYVGALLEMRKTDNPSPWVFRAPTKSGHMEPSIKKPHAKACKGGGKDDEKSGKKRYDVQPFPLYTLRHTCLTRWAPHMDPGRWPILPDTGTWPSPGATFTRKRKPSGPQWTGPEHRRPSPLRPSPLPLPCLRNHQRPATARRSSLGRVQRKAAAPNLSGGRARPACLAAPPRSGIY